MAKYIQHTLRLSDEFNEQLVKHRVEMIKTSGTYPSMNEILIQLIKIGLNGNTPDNEQEIVSTQPEDTDSAKSNNSIPDSEPKIVSSEPGHTDSNALKGWEEWSDEFSKEE